MVRITASAFLLTLAVASSVLVSASASAQSPSRRALEQARAHMEQGQTLYTGGRYLEAAEEFLAAYQSREFSAFLFNAALCYERFGDAGRAADMYQRYLDRDASAADRADVTAKITALRAQVAASRPPPDTTTTPPDTTTTPPDTTTTPPDTTTTPPVVTVTPSGPPPALRSLLSVTTEPEGARVIIRQGNTVVARGPSPFAETLDEGEYRLFVEHPDYRTVEQPVRIREGKVYVVFIALSQAQFLGYLNVVSNPPGAQVFVDDRAAGSQPAPYANEIPTGPHHIWIERPGYEPVERDVDIGLGEQVDVRVDLERVSNGRVRMIANVRPSTVTIDGHDVGTIPYEGDVPSGRHHLVVSADHMKDWDATVEIQRGQVTPIRVRLRPAPERGNAYATLTLGTVTLGGAIALSVFSHRLHDDLSAEQSAGLLASDDPRIREGRILSIGADVAYGASGLLGLLTLYYFIHDPLPDSEGTVLEPRDWTYLPTFDPTTRTASVTVGGRF